jgi:hypothetical protein
MARTFRQCYQHRGVLKKVRALVDGRSSEQTASPFGQSYQHRGVTKKERALADGGSSGLVSRTYRHMFRLRHMDPWGYQRIRLGTSFA